jgi:hypothetical protein
MIFYVICSYSIDSSKCVENILSKLLDRIAGHENLLVFTQKTEALTYATNLLAKKRSNGSGGVQFPIITVFIRGSYENITEKKYEDLSSSSGYFTTSLFQRKGYKQWQKSTQFNVVSGEHVVPILAEVHGVTVYSASKYQKYFNQPSKEEVSSSISYYDQVFLKEIRRTYLKEAEDLKNLFISQGISQFFIENIIEHIKSNKNREGDFYGMLLAVLHLSALNQHSVKNTTKDKSISDVLALTCRFPEVLSNLVIGYTKEQEISQNPLPTLSM